MKKIYALVVFSLLFHNAFSQVKFQRTYGGNGYDDGRCVKQTYDGGYIIAGSTSSFGAGLSDILLLKVDSLGNPLWAKTFGGANIDRGYSLDITNDSGFVICGFTNNFGSGGYDIYLIRTDSLGNASWTKTYGGNDWDFGFSIKQTPDGGFIIAGDSYSGVSGYRNPEIIKTDNAGNLQWKKELTIYNDEYVNTIGITNNNQYVVAGYSFLVNRTNSEDVVVHKLDSNGDSLWTKFIGDSTDEEVFSLLMLQDNSFVMVGSNLDTNNLNNLMIRLSENGDSLLYKLLSPDEDEVTYDVSNVNDDLIICGYTTTFGGGGKDFFITKTDTLGNVLLPAGQTYGALGDEIAYSVRTTSDGGYILCGSTTGYGPGPEAVFLVKVDSGFNTSATVVINVDEILFHSVNNNSIWIYPNPVSNYLTLSSNQKNLLGAKLNFELFSLFGQGVWVESTVMYASFKIDRTNIPAGSYFYRISESNSAQSLFSGILILQ
jgi:hypothetical protein